MRLTRKLLTELEESLWITLTPEQRVIMLHWYGHEPRHGWDEEDFVYGIRTVQRYYPDHRPKPVPDFLLKDNLKDPLF
jgi:hypothetical protein